MAISRMQQPRQQYGLGSLVKKAVRGVKKIVKSPLGKAALLYAGTAGLGALGGGGFKGLSWLKPSMVMKNWGQAGILGKLRSGQGMLGGFGNIFRQGGDPTKGFSMGRMLAGGLGAAAIAAPFLMKGDEEEEVDEESWTQVPSSIANIRSQARNYYTDPASSTLSFMPNKQFVDQNFYAADGGRAGLMNGGEPGQEQIEQMLMAEYVKYKNQGGKLSFEEFVQAVMQAQQEQQPEGAGMEQPQEVAMAANGGRIGYAGGQLVRPSADGSRPGYRGLLNLTMDNKRPPRNKFDFLYTTGPLNDEQKDLLQNMTEEDWEEADKGGFVDIIIDILKTPYIIRGGKDDDWFNKRDGGRIGYKWGGLGNLMSRTGGAIRKFKDTLVTKLGRMTDDVEISTSSDYADDVGASMDIFITAKSKKGKTTLDGLVKEGILDVDKSGLYTPKAMLEDDAIIGMEKLKVSGLLEEGLDFTRFDKGAGMSDYGVPGYGYDQLVETFGKIKKADGGRIGAYAGGLMSEDEDEYAYNPQAAMRMYKRPGKQEGGIMETEEASEMIDLGGKEKDYRETGGFVDLGGKERADDVPARLSKNEFVFTADAVRNAGGGDIDKGSEVMQNLMDNLEAGGEVSEESQGLEGAQAMYDQQQMLQSRMI